MSRNIHIAGRLELCFSTSTEPSTGFNRQDLRMDATYSRGEWLFTLTYGVSKVILRQS